MSSTSSLNLAGMELFQYGESLGHGDLHIKMDAETGLRAIVAIHNTNLGPALGGCRFLEYDSFDGAMYDALRLARGMTFKAAMGGLALGGGKAVVIRPKVIKNREALFEAFGRFVDELGGRYISAMDSGTNVADMDNIHRSTPYVACTTGADGHLGDPSYSTAWGVYQGMLATIQIKLNRTDFHGLHVVIQGVGHVGYNLAKHLYEAGASLTVCDMDAEAAQRCAREFKANVVDPNVIFDVACDVFAPCALGAIINDKTIARLNTKIIAGSANNQLAEARHGLVLKQKNILYAPDYVINAGGLIEAGVIYQNSHPEQVLQRVTAIHDSVYAICEEALSSNMDPAVVADNMAIKKIYGEATITSRAI